MCECRDKCAMNWRLGVVAIVSLGAGACADLARVKNSVFPAISAETAAEERPIPQAETRAVASDDENYDYWFAPPRVAAVPPAPRRKPDRDQPAAAVAEPDPDLLVGLDFEATKALLGDPALRMEQPPAKVWAYNGGTCMFSVFFYPSMDDSVFRVLTYEVTGKEPNLPIQTASGTSDTGTIKIRDRASPVLRRCFADLLHGREMPDAG